MSCYLCPLCSESLSLHPSGKSYHCPTRHNFDLAKEGYLNLLPVQHKHSLEPGDNKTMMAARREFLEAGYYEPMAATVAEIIEANQHPEKRLLDMGCGEGYYSRKIAAWCTDITLHGSDIAKFGIAAAAKKQPGAHFIVASSNRLPYADQYFDCLLKIFAPSTDSELKRLLRPSGLLLTVAPGPRHLWQLKEFIYAEAKDHSINTVLPPGFKLLDSRRIRYKIAPAQPHRMALLQMTPLAWRADKRIQQAIYDATDLEIETDFILTLAEAV